MRSGLFFISVYILMEFPTCLRLELDLSFEICVFLDEFWEGTSNGVWFFVWTFAGFLKKSPQNHPAEKDFHFFLLIYHFSTYKISFMVFNLCILWSYKWSPNGRHRVWSIQQYMKQLHSNAAADFDISANIHDDIVDIFRLQYINRNNNNQSNLISKIVLDWSKEWNEYIGIVHTIQTVIV